MGLVVFIETDIANLAHMQGYYGQALSRYLHVREALLQDGSENPTNPMLLECIRVLNDYAVGDTAMLLNAFTYIQNRFTNPETGEPGDLYDTPVVINMSLTATLPEEALPQWGFTDATIAPARLMLLLPMQALAENGVVFTASSGNGSGPRDQETNPPGERLATALPGCLRLSSPWHHE